MVLRSLLRLKPTTHGQALVEFAIMLPFLALLLVLAIDLGRVFFGWVGLQNATRIAANYAALNPLKDWTPDPANTNYQNYVAEILADAAAINCDLDEDDDGDIDQDDIPAPTFPAGTAPGGDAVVAMTCNFTLITPLAGNVVANPLVLGAEATFPIRTGIVGAPGGGIPPPDPLLCRVVPDMQLMYVADARDAWALAGFSGIFSPVSGEDDKLVDSQITTPASNPGDCIDFRSTVTVTPKDPPVCAGGELVLPNLVGLTVQGARDRWAANTFVPANFDPENGDDGQVVTAQVPTPDVNPGECADPTTQISVEFDDPPPPAPCEVPDFVGEKRNDAQGIWDAAGFSSTVQYNGGPGNWTISSQSVEANTFVDCGVQTVIVVTK